MIGRRAGTSGASAKPVGVSCGAAALRFTTAILAAVAVGLLLLPATAFASLYGSGLYPALSAFFSLLTSWTVLPLGISILPIACGIFLWRTLAPGRRLTGATRLLRALLLAVLLLSLYVVVWGANYRRPPLLRLVDVAPREVTQEELDMLAGQLLSWVRASASEIAGGRPVTVPDSDQSQAELARAALAAVSGELEKMSLEVGWPATVPSRLKLLPPGSLMRSGYAGMLFPFTLEPQLDSGLSDVSRVAIGAHELAHAAGFASEADADLAALLAGLRAPHPFARYATALSLLSRSLDSLSPGQRTFIVANLPGRARGDLSEARDRSRRYLRTSLAARVTAVYNRLLKGQGVEEGVDAYARAPELAALLAAEGLLPPAPPRLPDSGVDDGARPAIGRVGRPSVSFWVQ